MEHPDLLHFIKVSRAAGARTRLYTNGLRLGLERECAALSRAGLSRVHLQFDSLSEEATERLRGGRYVAAKRKAVEMCLRHRIPVVLEATVAFGVNHEEMGDLVRYAVEVGADGIVLRCLGRLGKASGWTGPRLGPDQILPLLATQLGRPDLTREWDLFEEFTWRLLDLVAGGHRLACLRNRHYPGIRGPGGAFIGALSVLPIESWYDALQGRRMDLRSLSPAAIGLALALLRDTFLPSSRSRRKRWFILELADICDPSNQDPRVSSTCTASCLMDGHLYPRFAEAPTQVRENV